MSKSDTPECLNNSDQENSSITSLMRQTRFSQLSRDRHQRSKAKPANPSRQPKKINNKSNLNLSNKNSPIKNEGQQRINKLCTQNKIENVDNVLVNREQLTQFTRKLAQQKAHLVQQNKILCETIKNMDTQIKQTQKKLIKMQEQIINLQKMSQKNIRQGQQRQTVLNKQNAEQRISMNHQIVTLKLQLQQQRLNNQRNSQFLKIKNQIIAKLQWQAKNRNNMISLNLQNRNSQNQKIQKMRSMSVRNGHDRNLSNISSNSKMEDPTQRLKKKTMILKKTKKQQKNTQQHLLLIRKASIPQLKQCQHIPTKLQGLIAAIRDRDLIIESLKQKAQYENKDHNQCLKINLQKVSQYGTHNLNIF